MSTFVYEGVRIQSHPDLMRGTAVTIKEGPNAGTVLVDPRTYLAMLRKVRRQMAHADSGRGRRQARKISMKW